MRVLIATQNPAERRRVRDALGGQDDVELIEAATPWEAGRLARSEDPDVLVVDGDLEPIGGFGVIYELRADAEFDQISSPPAVVLISRPEDRWLARWAGADSTLPKPVDPFRLAREVVGLAGTDPAARDAVEEAGRQPRAGPRS